MRYGCRYGMPHDPVTLSTGYTGPIYERCKICRKRFTWVRGYKHRIKNSEYLKVHARAFAQEFGATKRLFMKLYKPEQTNIVI